MRLFVVTLAMATAWPAAEAAAARYCALYRDAGRENCSFSTLAQCQAAVSGDGGFCQDRGGGSQSASSADGGGRKKSRRQN
jgi:hypothetical protein